VAHERAHVVVLGVGGRSFHNALGSPFALFLNKDRDNAWRDPSHERRVTRLGGPSAAWSVSTTSDAMTGAGRNTHIFSLMELLQRLEPIRSQNPTDDHVFELIPFAEALTQLTFLLHANFLQNSPGE
jgi:hypothetical protein